MTIRTRPDQLLPRRDRPCRSIAAPRKDLPLSLLAQRGGCARANGPPF